MTHTRTKRTPPHLQTLCLALLASTGACNLIVNTSVPDDEAGGRSAQGGASGASPTGGRAGAGHVGGAGGSIAGEAGSSGTRNGNGSGGAHAEGGASDAGAGAQNPAAGAPSGGGGVGKGGAGGKGGTGSSGGTIGGGGTLGSGGTLGGGGAIIASGGRIGAGGANPARGGTTGQGGVGGIAVGGNSTGGVVGSCPSGTQQCTDLPAGIVPTGLVCSTVPDDVKKLIEASSDPSSSISPAEFKNQSCVCVSGRASPGGSYAFVWFPKNSTFSEATFKIIGNTNHLNVYAMRGQSETGGDKYCHHVGSIDPDEGPHNVQTVKVKSSEFERGECGSEDQLGNVKPQIDHFQFQVSDDTEFAFCVLSLEVMP